MTPSDMDYIRAALANAQAEGMSIADLLACAEHAKTPQDFDTAINELAQMTPQQQ